MVAASKQFEAWDFDVILEWAGKKRIEWHLVPTGEQYFNGLAELIIRILRIHKMCARSRRKPPK